MVLLLMMTILFLAACSSSSDSKAEDATTNNQEVQDATETEQKDSESKEEKGQSIGVDKGLFNVEVTLPASFFEGEDIDQAIADAKAEGVGEVIKNDDGSVTYKMSKATHKEMMAELETSVQESLEEMKISEDFTSIKDVTGNKDYTEFNLVVDQAAYESSFDGFAIFGLGMLGMYYQVFDGTDAENARVEVTVEDEATGEVIGTSVFPDDLPE